MILAFEDRELEVHSGFHGRDLRHHVGHFKVVWKCQIEDVSQNLRPSRIENVEPAEAVDDLAARAGVREERVEHRPVEVFGVCGPRKQVDDEVGKVPLQERMFRIIGQLPEEIGQRRGLDVREGRGLLQSARLFLVQEVRFEAFADSASLRRREHVARRGQAQAVHAAVGGAFGRRRRVFCVFEGRPDRGQEWFVGRRRESEVVWQPAYVRVVIVRRRPSRDAVARKSLDQRRAGPVFLSLDPQR
mmetsp:Transcript_14997/g.50298  ORF Transcript_14997/g.50298 Transcript_14997/m.50298 type:complete len:245 (+) Transcript_14997:241-975(+)